MRGDGDQPDPGLSAIPAARRKFRTGAVIAAILIELSNAPADDSHGAGIMRRTELPSGQVYPALARLRKYGYVRAVWETELPAGQCRPLRRYHELTVMGRTLAQQEIRDVQRRAQRTQGLLEVSDPATLRGAFSEPVGKTENDTDDQPELNPPEHAASADTAAEVRLRQLTELLTSAGVAPEDARNQAHGMLERLNTVVGGSTWGGVHAEFIPRLLAQAMRQGQRRLILEIEAEGERDEWFGHLNVTIREAQSWVDWETMRREAAEKELN